LGFFAALAMHSSTALAFCRTLTCPAPLGYPNPGTGECVPPSAEFERDCALAKITTIVPLWWRNACISYDLQKDAAPGITLDEATSVVDTSFSTWKNATCPNGNPSINPMNLGPVSCDEVQYNSDQGNQHVIVFRTDTWPHDDAYNTLGLTTVTFDPGTGEIYDADTEINATSGVTLSTDQVPLSGSTDFQSIMTHEAGHFLGLAHATSESATMYYSYVPNSTTMRSLAADDITGICTIYPSDGYRTVDPSVSGGLVPEGPCDPTPRHGFSTQCAGPTSPTCSLGTSMRRSDVSPPVWAIGLIGLTCGALARSKKRRSN
jgi:hypothetical protein